MAARRASLVSFVLAGLVAGCAAAPTRPAPFHARPDAAATGDLRGPFDGQVLDASSRSPVAGAAVYATWTLETGVGLVSPAGTRQTFGSTDAAGNYVVPRLGAPPPGTRVTDFVVLVYKRGYVAYRSDRRFFDYGTRLDFAQQRNQVMLERWRSDYSHLRHVRFLGGGDILPITQWETAQAALELHGGTRAPDLRPGIDSMHGPYMVAAQLLTDADIKQQTKYDGGFETGPVADEPTTASYTTQHWKALGRPESFDVALRMWRLEGKAAQRRYDELTTSLPDIEEKDTIGTQSFVAAEGDIRGVGFIDVPRGIVVLFTCGKGQCATVDDAITLAEKIAQRIKTLWPTVSLDAPASDSTGATP